MRQLAASDFSYLADILLRDGGMVIEPDKAYLVKTRLMPIALRHGLGDLTALVERLKAGDAGLRVDIVDAMTVNETSFFRDPRIWEAMCDSLFPHLFESCQMLRRIDIWVAASSSGQEVYTLAMLLRETLGQEYGNWRIQIVASDLSREMVRRTRDGFYSDYEVSRGLSPLRRDEHMTRVDGGWVMRDELRDLVKVRNGNLTSGDMGVRGPFDLILLRNVLIYFKPAMRTAILARQAPLLRRTGRLVLGASEGALGVPSTLASLRTGSLVSYGRADATDNQPATNVGLSAATSSLMSQFPLAKPNPAASGPSDAASGNTLIPSATRSKLSVSSSELNDEQPTEPTTPSLLGAARVDNDGLTPLERLRALRKEYQT